MKHHKYIVKTEYVKEDREMDIVLDKELTTHFVSKLKHYVRQIVRTPHSDFIIDTLMSDECKKIIINMGFIGDTTIFSIKFGEKNFQGDNWNKRNYVILKDGGNTFLVINGRELLRVN